MKSGIGFGWGSKGGGGALATGILQLQGGVPLDTTLRRVADQAGTLSPLQLSTTQVGVAGLLRQYAQSGSGNISQNINNNIGYNRADGTTSDTMDYGACRYVTMSTYGPFMDGFTEKTRLDLNGKFGVSKTPSTYIDSDGPVRFTRGLDITNVRVKSPVYSMGDSLTFAGKYEAQLISNLGSDWESVNVGVGGETTAQMRARFSRDVLQSFDCEYVVILGGINDIIADRSAADIQTDLQAMYTAAAAAFPTIKVVACTITPFKGNAYWTSGRQTVLDAVNSWIMATATGVNYKVDSYTALEDPSAPDYLLAAYASADLLHLSNAGYVELGDTIHAGATWTQNAENQLTTTLRLHGLYGALMDQGTGVYGKYDSGNNIYNILSFGATTANTVEVGSGSTNTHIYGNITTIKGRANFGNIATTRPATVGEGYMDTAANILANGDLVMGIRQ